jgi:hypothetical protein
MLTTFCYPQKLELTSPTSGGRSVGIVRSQTEATEFEFDVSIRILDIIHCPFSYLKHDVSETGFCLHLQVQHTEMGPIDGERIRLRNVMF